MLLTRQPRRPSSVGLNMAPMIDVVFLLLIFFMCTSSFKQPERQMPSQLPQAGAAGDSNQTLDEVIRIRLTGAGSSVLVSCDRTPCASFEVLLEKLRARRALGDFPVVIQGDGSVPYGYMVAALDACHRADLNRVAFAAEGI